MKLTRLFLILGMLLILPASVLGATQILDTFDRADNPLHSGTSAQGVTWNPDVASAPTGCGINTFRQRGTGRGDNSACIATNLGNTSIYRINYSIEVTGATRDGSVSFRNSAGQIIAGHMWTGTGHTWGSSWGGTSFATVPAGAQKKYLIEFNATNNEFRINSTDTSETSGWQSAHNAFTEVASITHNVLHCSSCGNNADDYIDYFIASYSGVSPPGNTHPRITPIANQTIFEDTTLNNVLFNVSDFEDSVINLTVFATSSNTGLVPNANIFLGGHLGQRHLNITPLANAFGNTTINVTVNDTGGLTNSTLFNLEVLNVNDPPGISRINDKTMISNQTLSIGFNVTDIDNLFTDLSYTASFSDASLFTNFTFSNSNTSAQEFNITAGAIAFGDSEINISVSDGEYTNSTLFLMTVNCNTSVYNPSGNYDNPPTSEQLVQSCYIIDVSFDGETDILNYNFTDFGGTSNRSFIYVYKTTGGMNQEISYETTNNLSGTWYFDYSATYPNDDFEVYGWSRFTERNVTGKVLPADIQVFRQSYSQVATLNTFFSKSDGLMYALLILVLFATIGVASQSATLSLILSVTGLWLASKFVLDVPEEFLWIAGALVLFVIWYIAKLRVD
tara:strand:- start:1692 stop:3551 length:1860 start_codon:yes stop_codon:yes gene_type:complete